MAAKIDIGGDLVSSIQNPDLARALQLLIERINASLNDHETRIEALE